MQNIYLDFIMNSRYICSINRTTYNNLIQEDTMSFITEIFKRSTMKEITSYLLYGESFEGEDNADYHTRLKRACQRLEDTLSIYDSDKESVLHNAVNQFMGETERVYMEIGVKAGFLLAKEIFDEISDREHLIRFEEMCANMSSDISKAVKE